MWEVTSNGSLYYIQWPHFRVNLLVEIQLPQDIFFHNFSNIEHFPINTGSSIGGKSHLSEDIRNQILNISPELL